MAEHKGLRWSRAVGSRTGLILGSELVRAGPGETRNRYTVPCAAGYFTYERLWEPTGARFYPDSGKTDRAPEDRVGWRLRPLSRPDDLVEWYNEGIAIDEISRRKFSDHFGRRNDAESYNQW